MTPQEYTEKMLERVPVPLLEGQFAAIDPRTVIGITVVENMNQPNQYIIDCKGDQHYHTVDEFAIEQICEKVRFKPVSRTSTLVREA